MSGTALAPAYVARVAERARMLVATKTITVKDEDGNPERLEAGQSFVVADHWLIRTYPHLFAPGSEAAKYRTRQQATEPSRANWRDRLSPTPDTDRPKWNPTVKLQEWALPTLTVQLPRRARLAMGDLAYAERLRSYRQGDAPIREMGGALFGYAASDRDTVTVGRASEACRQASASSMQLDIDHVRREDAQLEREGSVLRWCGCWHTHPNDVGGTGRPSVQDLKFFAWDCREFELAGRSSDYYVALILTPTWDENTATGKRFASWASPDIHGWHMQWTDDDEGDDFTCVPARVVEP